MSDNKWISVKERLPKHGQKVLITINKDNVRPQRDIEVAVFYKGRTYEECNGVYRFCDQFGNNLVPYAWKSDCSHMQWFGQDVTHWMELPELP